MLTCGSEETPAETRNWRPETGDQKLETRNWRPETGDQKLETFFIGLNQSCIMLIQMLTSLVKNVEPACRV